MKKKLAKTDAKPAGRKRGRKNSFTKKGLSMFENELRAHYGADHSIEPGHFWANQLWTERHPSQKTLQMQADARRITPAELLAEIRQAEITPLLLEMMIHAIDKQDHSFFFAAGRSLERINPDGTIRVEEPLASALIAFLDFERWKDPHRKFTRAEILDGVNWGVDENGHKRDPSEREVGRLCTKFDVPMRLGAPRKK